MDIQSFDHANQKASRLLPLPALGGGCLVYSPDLVRSSDAALNLLMMPMCGSQRYGIKAMTEEIVSTLAIDGIKCPEENARRMLTGYAPADRDDSAAFALKCGLDFISSPLNRLNGQNLHALYQIAIDNDSCGPIRLRAVPGSRHDGLYITGLIENQTEDDVHRLTHYLDALIRFVDSHDELDDLVKSAVIHFYIAYIRPYPSGNGRLARLIQLWYLASRDYSAALYLSPSTQIMASRNDFYSLLATAENRAESDGLLDITPFLLFYKIHVFDKMSDALPAPEAHAVFIKALEEGRITDKDRDLWLYVLSAFGKNEFSARQLTHDYGNASYSTVFNFTHKFTSLGLLASQRKKDRVSYHI